MNTFVKKHLCLSLLCAPIVFLSGCLPGSEDNQSTVNMADAKSIEDGSEVLLTIDGRPVITMNTLNAEFDRLLEESPQMKQILPFMPDAKGQFFQGMVNQEVVDHYVAAKGIDRSPQYIKEYENTMQQVKKMLNTKHFSDKHPVQVSGSEVNAFYEENKNKIPDLMISQGGVKAEGVSFESEDEANAFLAKAREGKNELEKVAGDAGFTNNYRDFKMVNNQSLAIDPALRTKLLGLNRFPTHDVVKVGDVWWVVKAHSKEEPQYRPLDEQLRQGLEEHLKKQKQAEVFEKAIDGYKKDFNVEINDAPLQPKANEQGANPLAQMMAEQETAVAQGEMKDGSVNASSETPQQAMQTV